MYYRELYKLYQPVIYYVLQSIIENICKDKLYQPVMYYREYM